MVYKRGKKIELRKRKETEKEKKSKSRKKKKKEFKEWFESFRLSFAIFVLIGVNLIFILSIIFQSFTTQGTTGSIRPSRAELVRPDKPRKIIKVKVRNGCGVKGVAKKLTDYLRQRNIDVVEFDNFEKYNISETIVIDRRNYDLKNAKIIGKIIGVDESRMFPYINPDLQLDATIIIGKDYLQLRAF